MYLYVSPLSAAASSATTTAAASRRTLLNSSLSSLIPYCRLILLLSMIPAARCQTNSDISKGISHSGTVSTTQLQVDSSLTKDISTTHSTVRDSYGINCEADQCSSVFNDSYHSINIADKQLYNKRQCNYTLFKRLLGKFDCEPADDSDKEHLRPYSRDASCSTCLNYYKQWLCTSDTIYTNDNGSSYMPCLSLICHRAKRACPYIHPVETSYSSEPGFLCNESVDVVPCYYLPPAVDRDINLEQRKNKKLGYSGACHSFGSNGTICILTSSSSSSSLHRFSSSIALVYVALLTLVFRLTSSSTIIFPCFYSMFQSFS